MQCLGFFCFEKGGGYIQVVMLLYEFDFFIKYYGETNTIQL